MSKKTVFDASNTGPVAGVCCALTHSLKGTLGYFDDPRADAAIHLLTGMLTVRHVQDGAAVGEQLADRVRAIQAAWHACAGELPNED